MNLVDSLKLKRVIFFLAFILIVFNSYILYGYIKTRLLCSKNTIMNIVAHPDDDLLFLSPDLLHDISAGKCIVSVFITAGDAGLDSKYWLKREEGIKNAYAKMDDSKVTLVFLRLPDGNFEGTGYKSNNQQSISGLYRRKIAKINSLDGSKTYTKESLIKALLLLMQTYKPVEIHTQDFLGKPGQGDHSDHYFTGYFVRLAEDKYQRPHTIVSYLDYLVQSKPINISEKDYLDKRNAFMSYAQHDAEALKQNYLPWLWRQYKIYEEFRK